MIDRLFTIERFLPIRIKIKEDDKRLVFTNGCFDLLHKGHIEYLKEAKALGDYLIIGLNSDNSVKNIKGPNRPINNEIDRAGLLLALRYVDYVILFDELTPLKLITAIKPDILVKGGDWQKKDIIGWDIVESYGGKVLSLSFIPGYSTTELIKKIISVYSNNGD